ncbi:hypothetical protein LH396_00200 [Fusobacterium nucleatum]
MFHSCYFYNYLDTAYKSPHFPVLTFPILLVPYFVPPSNLLGTFYIKVNRLENFSKNREIILTKDLDRDLFSRYSGTIPSDIFPSKIINIILEEGSGAPAGYDIVGNKITAFYFNYQLTAKRKAKIIYY